FPRSFIKSTHVAEVVPKSVAGSCFPAASSTYLYEEIQICVDVSCVQADWMLPSKFIVQSSRYGVPTGRVVVPTGRYIVPAGKVIIIVSNGRLSLVPTGRVVVPTGRYIVPAGKVIIIVSTARLSLVPTGRVLSPGRVK
ncbi:hypothetical protein Tco_1512748, partial [Tanacetum coccineum]